MANDNLGFSLEFKDPSDPESKSGKEEERIIEPQKDGILHNRGKLLKLILLVALVIIVIIAIVVGVVVATRESSPDVQPTYPREMQVNCGRYQIVIFNRKIDLVAPCML